MARRPSLLAPLAGVETAAGLDAYPFPDLSAVRTLEALRCDVATLKAQGYTVIGQMSQTILETAYLMRGMDRLFMDLVRRPGYVDALFARLAEQRVSRARLFAQAGVDLIRIGDDIATRESLMLSPRLYRERVKPYHAAVVAEARKWASGIPVLYHSDGRLTDLLPDLLDVGVTAINPVQPECMDLLETTPAVRAAADSPNSMAAGQDSPGGGVERGANRTAARRPPCADRRTGPLVEAGSGMAPGCAPLEEKT